MAIRVALHHETRYAYDRPVTLSPQIVRLRPAPHGRTPILSYSLDVEPADLEFLERVGPLLVGHAGDRGFAAQGLNELFSIDFREAGSPWRACADPGSAI